MRNLLLLMIVWCSLSSNAQSIKYDGIGDDGRHQINGELKDYRMDNGSCSIGLKVYESDTDLDWRIVISATKKFTKDYVVLIKLYNGHVIELKADSIQGGLYTGSKVTYGTGLIYPGIGMVNTFGITTPSSVHNWSAIEACLRPEQLDSICNFGISKIRVGTEYSYDGKEWKKDQLGKYLGKSRNKLQYRLDNPLIRNAAKVRYPKSVHNGF